MRGRGGLRGRGARFGRFGLVGVSGLGINSLALLVLVEGTGLHYLVGAVLATQASTLWNFAGVEWWAYRTGRAGRLRRLATFAGMNNVAAILRLPLIWAFTSGLGVHPSLSNLASMALLTAARFALADTVIWRAPDDEPEIVAPRLLEA